MTTNASARQPTPPSRNASGVEPPLTAATPDTLRSMAMPGASTDTEMAMASHSRSEPCASSPVAAPGIRSGLVLAIFCVPLTAARPVGGPYGRASGAGLRDSVSPGPQVLLCSSCSEQDGLLVQVVVEGQRRAV